MKDKKFYTGVDVKEVGVEKDHYTKPASIYFILKDGQQVYLETKNDLLPFLVYGHNIEFTIYKKRTRHYVKLP
jgi:hypothetical protein